MTSFPPMFLERRHTTTFMQMKKETLVHQNLCLKRSLKLKSFLASQWCTWTHVSWYLDINWAYSMNAEYFFLGQYIMVHLRNSNIVPNPKLVTFRKHCWLVLFGTEYITDTDTGNILQQPMRPHTDSITPTEWLCPMNIKYSDVSKFLGFHLSKVSFSSTKTSWIPGNTGESR
jgi:hypothetical protein